MTSVPRRLARNNKWLLYRCALKSLRFSYSPYVVKPFIIPCKMQSPYLSYNLNIEFAHDLSGLFWSDTLSKLIIISIDTFHTSINKSMFGSTISQARKAMFHSFVLFCNALAEQGDFTHRQEPPRRVKKDDLHSSTHLLVERTLTCIDVNAERAPFFHRLPVCFITSWQY